MKDFKYKATFETQGSIRKRTMKDFEASASVEELKELRSLLPEDNHIKENDDLLFCSFNVAVAGLINLNNHGILPATAEKMAKYWPNRPINIEHNRNTNVGCIISAGCSTFGENKMLLMAEAVESQQPFNICLGGVVWKVADRWFADYLEYTQEKDEWAYARVGTSWEVGFDEYVIARGSKNLFQAEIITDQTEIERLTPYLLQFGGTGFDDKNVECYMVISGEARPLGCGFTESPAAPVKGIFIPEIPKDKAVSSEKAKENEKKISPPKRITVKTINDMKFNNVAEFCDKYAEAQAKQEVFAAADVRDFITESLSREAAKWQSQVTEKEAAIADANKKINDLQAAVDIAKEDGKKAAADFAELKTKLEEIEAKAVQAAAEAAYNTRMSELDSKYTLSDKVRKVVAKSILNKTDEEYASWLENEGEVILSGKEKAASEPEKTPEQGLKDAQADTEFVPNTPKIEDSVKVLKAQVAKKNDQLQITIS